MRVAHALEALGTRALYDGLAGVPWSRALAAGAALGGAVRRLGIRRRVARENLALAFPGKGAAERDEILARHYRELGRIAVEYGRLPELARSRPGDVVAGVEGFEHLDRLRGRGALLLSGHLGNFELLGAWLGRTNPVDFLVQPLANPAVEEVVNRLRHAAGVGVISTSGGVKQVFRALRAGRWIAIVADQDQRRRGLFVPFFGRLASTAEGPARIALQLRVPIVFGAARREADGRHRLYMDPPHLPDAPADDANVLALTAWHAARLEARIREAPEFWFWLHRRWKTPPPAATGGTDAPL